jgi:hypothetical protein
MLILLGLVGVGLSAFVFDFGTEDEDEDEDGRSAYSDGHIEPVDVELEDVELEDVELEDVELEDVELEDVELEDIELEDVELEDIELGILNSTPDQILSGVKVQLDVASGVAHLVSNESDHLVGGIGNDLIVLGEHDIGEGGDGSDTFVVGESVENNVPIILDFEIDRDLIKISLPSPEDLLAETWPDRPEFEGKIEFSFNDSNTYIWVDERLVCKLEGLHEISTEDIEVEYDFFADLPTNFDQTYGY